MQAQAKTTTLLLGPEYDPACRQTLARVLQALGAVRLGQFEGVAGSQYLHGEAFALQGSVLQVEAETYQGLRLQGPAALVQQVKTRFDHAMQEGPAAPAQPGGGFQAD